MKKLLLTATLLVTAAFAQAQMSPLGAWHSIDDATGKPKAVIRIALNAAGGLSGVVEKALDPKPSTEPNCDKCSDDRKGKPKHRQAPDHHPLEMRHLRDHQRRKRHLQPQFRG